MKATIENGKLVLNGKEYDLKESINLSHSNLSELPAGLKVVGSLYLRGTKITSLPSDLEVGGEIYKDF